MSQMFNASEELAGSVNYTDIRIFTVDMQLSTIPLMDLAQITETWSLPSSSKLTSHSLINLKILAVEDTVIILCNIFGMMRVA